MAHVYGMDPTPDQVAKAVERVEKSYEGLPETTCAHRACCCESGCPNMYYAEFLNIYTGHVVALPAELRLDLTVECIRRYLTKQGPGVKKPCVFLGKDKMCAVYPYRPLKCRLYGLIPDRLYDWIVDEVSKDTGVQKEEIPLCHQCPFVKVKPEFAAAFPDGKVPEKMIQALEGKLRHNDIVMGMPPEKQKAGMGFLTYHDWHIMLELGEGMMEVLTPLRLNLAEEKKEQFISALKEQLRQKYEPQG